MPQSVVQIVQGGILDVKCVLAWTRTSRQKEMAGSTFDGG